MTKKSHLSANALKTLTTMALAIPMVQDVKGETPITKPQTDFRYTHYNEEKRYQIDVYQAQLGIALGPKMDLTVKANMDAMTGASPVLYMPKAGSPETLESTRTGDSIQNKRSSGDLNVRFFGDDYNVAVGANISEETFYESQTVRVQMTNEFNKGNTELTWGYSVSNDSVNPIPNANSIYPQRIIQRQTKLVQRVSCSLKQDLGKTSLVQVGAEFIADKGYLNDPYKYIYIYDNPHRSGATVLAPGGGSPFAVPVTYDHDKRPKYRGALALGARFIQYIEPLGSSLHLGYRFAKNTWDIRSHTVDLEYHQEVGNNLEIVPSFRYYTQGEAYFYSMAFDALGTAPFPAKRIGSTGPASSDYRLGKFGSITGELKLHYKFMENQSSKLTFVFGYINRRNQFHWGKKPNPLNPDNNFKTYYGSVGLNFTF